jgi:hypothetical protein
MDYFEHILNTGHNVHIFASQPFIEQDLIDF